jgi:hypothetical protein
MKNTAKIDILQKSYFQKLLSDRSVDDKMPLFTKAKQIFEMVRKKKHR